MSVWIPKQETTRTQLRPPGICHCLGFLLFHMSVVCQRLCLCFQQRGDACTTHPHFEYPQFKHVAQPSMMTSALVLHLWQRVADGGKLVPSPVTAMSSWEAGSFRAACEASTPPRPSPAFAREGEERPSSAAWEEEEPTSEFFFLRGFRIGRAFRPGWRAGGRSFPGRGSNRWTSCALRRWRPVRPPARACRRRRP